MKLVIPVSALFLEIEVQANNRWNPVLVASISSDVKASLTSLTESMTSSAEVQITRETDFSKDVFKSDKEDSVSHNFVVACSSFFFYTLLQRRQRFCCRI